MGKTMYVTDRVWKALLNIQLTRSQLENRKITISQVIEGLIAEAGYRVIEDPKGFVMVKKRGKI